MKNISMKQVCLSSNRGKYLLIFSKQYKTKKIDTKAEQWRPVKKISGKFISEFHKFLRRPETFNNLIEWFQFRMEVRFQSELAFKNKFEKNNLVNSCISYFFHASICSSSYILWHFSGKYLNSEEWMADIFSYTMYVYVCT